MPIAGKTYAEQGLSLPPRKGEISQVETAQPRQLSLVIRPAVRDRWIASQIGYYTPQIVENTVRGAMSGNVMAQWLMFDLMEQTWPELNKDLNELKDAAIDLSWPVMPFAYPNQKPSQSAILKADLCDWVLHHMRPEIGANENDFDDTLRDAMDSVGKGISVMETLWDKDLTSAQIDGKNIQVQGVRATRWVHPRYYGYPSIEGNRDALMLNTREVAFVNPEFSKAGQPLWIPFPEDQFIVSVMKRKSGHPLNSSLLRILGFWWAGTNFVWEWFLNFTQIFGVPIRWANYDPNMPDADKAELDNFLAQMGSTAYARFPSGTNLQLVEAAKSGNQVAHKVWIDEANAICDKLVLGQTLTSDQGQLGSQALGTVHKDVRDEKIQAVANRVAKTLNTQFLPAICKMNFGDDDECPSLVPSSKNTGDALGKINRDKQFVSIAPVGKKWFYDRHEIPMPEPDEETIGGQATQPQNGLQSGLQIGPQLNPEEDKNVAAGKGEDGHWVTVNGQHRFIPDSTAPKKQSKLSPSNEHEPRTKSAKHSAGSGPTSGSVESAAHDIGRGSETSPGHDTSAPERTARIADEQQRLRQWASNNGKLKQTLPQEHTRGSEHIVDFSKVEKTGRVFKATRPDSHKGYGIALGSYSQGATPSEYLDRVALHNRIFNDDVRLEHVVPVGSKLSIVTSQPMIEGREPSQDELDSMMHSKGFEHIGKGMYHHAGEGLLVHDLVSKNARVSSAGIIHPIDPVIQRVKPDFADFLKSHPITGAAKGEEKINEADKSLIVASLLTDFESLNRRLAAVAKIDDAELQRRRLAEVLAELDRFKQNLNKDSATAEAIYKTLAANFANGVAAASKQHS